MNDPSIVSLKGIFSKIIGNNLLILDRSLLPLINYLIPFLQFKQFGKFNDLVWLDLAVIPLDAYDGVIIIFKENEMNLNYLIEWQLKKKMHLIIPNLTKLFTYQLNKQFKGNVLFTQILESEPKGITYKIRLYKWDAFPIETEGVIITGSSLKSYFEEPLSVVNQLVDSVVPLLFSKDLKLKNVYAQGDLSEFFVRSLDDVKLPEYLNSHMSKLELEFYKMNSQSNTDLIVVERNLDWIPVIFNQLSYHGLVDDLFGIQYGTILLSKSTIQDDPLYDTLKDLNFSTVGQKLNYMAKGVQSQYNKTLKTTDLEDMKKIVTTLNDLTTRQELIKKHTTISEEILQKTSEIEDLLQFQNDLFETDYKLMITTLNHFLKENLPPKYVLNCICMVSTVNDGIKTADYEHILNEVMNNYGLEVALQLELIIKNRLIRIVEPQDFFGRTVKEEPRAPQSLLSPRDNFISTYTLIDKFWNLHPQDPEEPRWENEKSAEIYSHPSFTLPGGTVPLIIRLIESLYSRDFLTYKPMNNTKRRPNWENLPVDTMFHGAVVDLNLDDNSDKTRVNDVSSVCVVVFIGGITRSEISCLRWLEQKLGREFIIVSNCITGSGGLYE